MINQRNTNEAVIWDNNALKQKANEIRCDVLNMIYHAGTGHIGGSLSSVDILVTLFYQVMNYDVENLGWEQRDRFILSKGHSCEGYYAILADCGFFSRKELEQYQKFNSLLGGHPHSKIPGVEMATGSLGHGPSLAVGMALAGKMDHQAYRVFCLTGDGELAEGSIWEASMAAVQYKLDNLVWIIDCNGLQISGSTQKVMNTEPLAKRWLSFGWNVQEIDGHNFTEIMDALNKIPCEKGKPSLIIAHTIKGKGISFMEGNHVWHHRVPKADEYEQAIKELK